MNVALLISGSGSTAEAVIKSSQEGQLKGLITPVVVISSDPGAEGIGKSKARGVPVEVIEKNQNSDVFGEKLLYILKKYDVELVSQNGWLPLTPKRIIETFDKKIINQHPGPLDPGRPDFGGKGMYGARVICARIIYCMLSDEKDPWTETVTHFVTEEFDLGKLIRVKRLDFSVLHQTVDLLTIEQDQDLQSYIKEKTRKIQRALLPLEHENIITTLADFARGIIPLYNRSNFLIPDDKKELLLQAKGEAIQLFP